ncbi:hypothetical protein [Bradyrhizobium sp. BRP56]|uniref:hypothetical protein n=1 Tax=Bradyrhizobium sp. BRP56 TaxID=2793819 RepID=UPI001CD7F1F6|nr:hypothetical protein [Bradyrhizobium sp. BRP56]MCA1400690.1 hypothetical protein [Bradyrhizobium sp. BRP56]
MSAFEQGRVRSGDDGLANAAAEKLRSMIPAAGAMAYPFLLDAFHLAVSPAAGPMSFGRLALAALCLLAATAAPLLGLACAYWMTKAEPSSFELRARRLAYLSIAAPPLFVLTGVGLGLLHIPVSDELVWVAGWAAACLYVLLGGEQEGPAGSAAIAPSIAKWRVTHGVAAAVILLYVAFHLTNHLLGWLGPEVHAAVMKMGRTVYRSSLVEPILVGLMLFQVAVGMRLAWRWSFGACGCLPRVSDRLRHLSRGVHRHPSELRIGFGAGRAPHRHQLGLGVGRTDRPDPRRLEHPPGAALRTRRVLRARPSRIGIARRPDRPRRRYHGRQPDLGNRPRRRRAGRGRDHERIVRGEDLLIAPKRRAREHATRICRGDVVGLPSSFLTTLLGS